MHTSCSNSPIGFLHVCDFSSKVGIQIWKIAALEKVLVDSCVVLQRRLCRIAHHVTEGVNSGVGFVSLCVCVCVCVCVSVSVSACALASLIPMLTLDWNGVT